ncbi:MAG: DUF2793 domain-containing protein [Rickettsiales bacterium]|nr:DUF2793 domain-containing protein [Rickettsiales bacterium]
MDFEYTSNLKLPLMLPNQSGKEITHNEALVILDNIIQNPVIDNTLHVPPANPIINDLYIVGSDATDEWTDKENCLAFYDNGWNFVEPKEGFTFFLKSSHTFYTFDGEDWKKTSKTIKFSDLYDVSIEELAIDDIVKYDGECLINTSDISLDSVNIKNFLGFNNDSSIEKTKIQLNDSNNLAIKISAGDNEWNESVVVNNTTGRVDFKYGIGIDGTDLENLLGSNITQSDMDNKLEIDGSNITDNFRKRFIPDYENRISFNAGFVVPSNGFVSVFSSGSGVQSGYCLIQVNGMEIGIVIYNGSITFNVKTGDIISFDGGTMVARYRFFFPYHETEEEEEEEEEEV